MPITKRDQQELDRVYLEFRERYGGLREDYFALLYLTSKFKCKVSDVAAQVAFGNHDYGVDAYHIDREGRNLYLYQFKWTEDHNQFKLSLDKLAKDGMDRIFGNALQAPEKNEMLHKLRYDLDEYQALVDRVYVRFVFKGDAEKADHSEGLSDRREKLDGKAWLVESFFKDRRVVYKGLDFESDKRGTPQPNARDSHKISLKQHVSIETDNEKKLLHVGFVPIMDLFRIYKNLGKTFFERNIRLGLSSESPPNRKIREALSNIVLKRQPQPVEFAFNHNGVTLAADHIEFMDGEAILESPRLLNGAQTITSVARFLEDNQGNPALKSGEDLLEKIVVLAKLVEDNPWSDFVTSVTICNNQQNPVHSWNLRANDTIQCDLSDKFRDAGIFYSRQENAFQSFTSSELDEMGIEDSRDIRIRPLAQTFLASQGEIDKMSRMSEVFSTKKLYQETFRESYYTKSPVGPIVLGYKIGLVLNSPMQRLNESAPAKYSYAIGRSRNLVWALLIQAVLNDPKLPELVDYFGGSLARESDFRERMKAAASSKVLPVLKQILSEPSYIDRIAAGKYNVMSTKEVFRRSMLVAEGKYGWSKRSL